MLQKQSKTDIDNGPETRLPLYISIYHVGYLNGYPPASSS